jgi:hypothetical protein
LVTEAVRLKLESAALVQSNVLDTTEARLILAVEALVCVAWRVAEAVSDRLAIEVLKNPNTLVAEAVSFNPAEDAFAHAAFLVTLAVALIFVVNVLW